MTRKENIDLLIRRAFSLGLFLFALLVFKSTDSAVNGAFDKSGTIEIALEKDNSAILVESLSITPGYDNAIVWCKLSTVNKSSVPNYRMICANNVVYHLLQLSDHRFWEVKTYTINQYPHGVRTSLDSGEVPLIS